ncbi:MAG TPA: hypothetical protein VF941_20520 [Clostridia bacterium]
MKILIKIFCILAVIGFVLSFFAHFSTYFMNPQRNFPFLWILHVGIFIVGMPAVFVAKYKNPGSDKRASLFEKVKSASVWIQILCVVFILYTVINFGLFGALTKDGNPDIISGNYVISNHGKIVRVISEDEYEKHRSYEVRGFSGAWMLFYIIFSAMLFSQWEKE